MGGASTPSLHKKRRPTELKIAYGIPVAPKPHRPPNHTLGSGRTLQLRARDDSRGRKGRIWEHGGTGRWQQRQLRRPAHQASPELTRQHRPSNRQLTARKPKLLRPNDTRGGNRSVASARGRAERRRRVTAVGADGRWERQRAGGGRRGAAVQIRCLPAGVNNVDKAPEAAHRPQLEQYRSEEWTDGVVR